MKLTIQSVRINKKIPKAEANAMIKKIIHNIQTFIVIVS